MSASSKSQNEQHLIDGDGQKLLRSVLPRSWRLREYHPDYGLDFALELFAGEPTPGKTYPTLGEHIFIQLKSTRKATISPLKVFARNNVEKGNEPAKTKRLIATIDTARYSLDTDELLTVHRMGAAVPVLLVIADLARTKCYFVCLNDYIDKLLVPSKGNYLRQSNKLIHVPVANEIGTIDGTIALRWYGKRAKMYAAFQKIRYQQSELQHKNQFNDSRELRRCARLFAERLLLFDFWTSSEMCPILAKFAGHLHSLVKTGQPRLLNIDGNAIQALTQEGKFEHDTLTEWMRNSELQQIWDILVNIGATYEEIWREWFLPTALGLVTSDNLIDKSKRIDGLSR